MTTPLDRIAAPDPPVPPPPAGFPVAATLAPVVVSVALWMLTQSVFALLFAVLGPVVAVGSLVDTRVQSRRRLRRERQRFDAEILLAEAEIVAAQARERTAAEALLPSAPDLVAGRWPDAEHWRATGRENAVRLGRGERTSAVQFDRAGAARRTDPGTRSSLDRLARGAATLTDAPMVLDCSLGIGVVGPPVLADALARAVVVQLAAALPPRETRIELSGDAAARQRWVWLEALPHSVAVAEAGGATVLTFLREARSNDARGRPACLVATAAEKRDLPTAARVVVELHGGSARVVQHPDRLQLGPLRAEFVSLEQAAGWAAGLRGLDEKTAVRPAGGGIPELLAFSELLAYSELLDQGGNPGGPPAARPSSDRTPTSLDCAAARTEHGVLRLDLVAQGPHAVVGGTTGSGKSELLVAWVLAMAEAHSPRELSVLLVDFKGGSAFGPLSGLPHCVGVITDLDDATALRALQSLAAELRRRETHLAGLGARSIDDLAVDGRLPRLVIVVDEFAAMVAGYPDLHALFSDIAARGRSLGVHLVLCTQRPAGVIRDAVLANSALRVSLRVNNRADSTAVIGTDAAAGLPAARRGRALVSIDGQEPLAAQFPLVVADDIARVAHSWRNDAYRPHRPWRDPLPPVVAAGDLRPGYLPPGKLPPGDPLAAPGEGPSLVFGLLDDPARQSQPLARYSPAEHGSLLVVGGSGSGKSELLATLEAAAGEAPARSVVLPRDIEGAWDTLRDLSGGAAATGAHGIRPTLLLVDDVDVLLSRVPEDYEAAFLGMLQRMLREGPSRGIRCVLSAQRLTAQLHSVAALCGSRLLLRLPSRQEHVVAGGDPALFQERGRPGSGAWEGLRLQVALSRPAAAGRASPAPPAPGRRTLLGAELPLAVVSSRPAEFSRELRRALPAFAAAGAIVELDAAAQAGAPSPLDAARAQRVSVPDGPRASAMIGDAEAWQAHWGAIPALRSSHRVVVHGYHAAEFRAITRLRELPPPLDGTDGAFWLLEPHGGVARSRLP